MSIFQSVILGAVQGLTEFLPVSSSGHLAILQNIFPGFSQPGVLFDVVLHLGTSLAVVYYFRKNIVGLVKKYWLLVIVGSIPAAFLGFFFSDVVEGMFVNLTLVGFALILTGFMNIFTDLLAEKDNKIGNIKAFIVGIFQSMALTPGISRSGSTIFAGNLLGINKKQAAKFSFVLSVPVVIGANLLQVVKYAGNSGGSILSYLTGFVFAFIFGVLAIRMVFSSLSKSAFKYFGFYCLVVGVFIIAFV